MFEVDTKYPLLLRTNCVWCSYGEFMESLTFFFPVPYTNHYALLFNFNSVHFLMNSCRKDIVGDLNRARIEAADPDA
eukprot:gene25563-biopygen10692